MGCVIFHRESEKELWQRDENELFYAEDDANIAGAVNGNYVNNNTLTVTMKRLRDKLHQPSCLKTIRSVGYRMEDTI